MGWSYINMKNWDAAIAAFNQAVQIDPPPRPRPTTRSAGRTSSRRTGQGAGVLRQGLRAGRADRPPQDQHRAAREGPERRKQRWPRRPAAAAGASGRTLSQTLGPRETRARARKAARDLASLRADGCPALINASRRPDWESARPRPTASAPSAQGQRGHPAPHVHS
jgi:hypothetical protein